MIPVVPLEEGSEDKPPSLRQMPAVSTALPDVAPLKAPSPFMSSQWNHWPWQMRNRIRAVDRLQEILGTPETPQGLAEAAGRFPMAITPYYASLIQRLDDRDPIFAMSVPQAKELLDPPFLKDDPLEENHDMPIPGLVHRYTDRALLIATTTCAMYCRHCTRKRVAGQRESAISAPRLRQVVAYLRAHPEVRDVIVSGGDPFTMATAALEKVLAAVREVPSVDIIRIGTRVPVTLPMRVTDELVAMLRRYQPIWINTHFNHPRELTPEAQAACTKLADAGLPLGNQSVLLKGINDDPQVMETLCRGLVRMRVRPYYLFQCDLVRGVEHFRTPLARGIEIMEYLRGRLSGLAIPTFVVDVPHGGGKVPVLPSYIVSSSPTHTVIRNFEGVLVSYPEPCASSDASQTASEEPPSPTVFDLARGRATRIQPASTLRQKRRSQKKLYRAGPIEML